MFRRLAIVLGLFAALGASEAAYAASTINPGIPQDGVPYSPAPIRQNFQAAANDIVALQTMNAGASPPSNPTTGTLWLNTPQNGRTYTLNIWDGPGHSWLPIAALDTTNNVWMPPVGGGLLPNVLSAQTSDLGLVPQAALNLTGNNTVFSFGATAPPGIIKFIIFTSSPTLVFNATSMLLPTGANAQPGPGDVAIALHLGQGKWKILFITQHGSVPGEADLRVGLGLTAAPGADNSTPVNLASGTLYAQIFPRDFANSHAILPDDMGHLLTASAGGLVAFTLPPAGGMGFEAGVGVCFEANGAGGFTLAASTPSVLLGIPLTAGIATIPQFGNACAVSDGTNWNVTSSTGSGGGPPPTIPNLNLGLGFTTTPGADNTTPLTIATGTLYGQIFPVNYTALHTVLSSEIAHLLTASGGSLVAFTLPNAGSTGFEEGNGVCFEGDGAGGFTLTSSAPSVLLGVPVSSNVATFAQFGNACAVSDGTNWHVATPNLGGGSITSINATVPVEFVVGGVPITTAGTIAITKATELANTVWAGPTTGSAAQPTFRALVSADLPACSHTGNYGCINLENTWALHQQPAVTALTDASTITVDGTAANLYTVTITGNSHTLACPGTIRTGTYNFRITQDGSGHSGFSTASCYKYPSGTAPAWSSSANAIDVLSCSAFDTSRLECNALISLQ